MTCVLRFNRVLSCTTVPRKASISVSFVLAGSKSSTCRSQLKGRRGERDQYRRSTKEADLGGVYQVMMPCQHRQGVLDVGLRLCCVLWNLDAKALQVGWRQVIRHRYTSPFCAPARGHSSFDSTWRMEKNQRPIPVCIDVATCNNPIWILMPVA